MPSSSGTFYSGWFPIIRASFRGSTWRISPYYLKIICYFYLVVVSSSFYFYDLQDDGDCATCLYANICTRTNKCFFSCKESNSMFANKCCAQIEGDWPNIINWEMFAHKCSCSLGVTHRNEHLCSIVQHTDGSSPSRWFCDPAWMPYTSSRNNMIIDMLFVSMGSVVIDPTSFF